MISIVYFNQPQLTSLFFFFTHWDLPNQREKLVKREINQSVCESSKVGLSPSSHHCQGYCFDPFFPSNPHAWKPFSVSKIFLTLRSQGFSLAGRMRAPLLTRLEGHVANSVYTKQWLPDDNKWLFRIQGVLCNIWALNVRCVCLQT